MLAYNSAHQPEEILEWLKNPKTVKKRIEEVKSWGPMRCEKICHKAVQKLLKNKEEFLSKKERGRSLVPLANEENHQPEEILEWLNALKTLMFL